MSTSPETGEDVDVVVREVGLRDGLQIIKPILPTEDKKNWCTRAAEAGFREIEVTSFVPPKYIPQFFDSAELIAHANSFPALKASALVPNYKGAEMAMACKTKKIIYIISVSESFNKKNVKRTREESVDDLKRILAYRDSLPPGYRPEITAGLSSVFGCTMEGRIPVREIMQMVEVTQGLDIDELTLADTTGYGDPTWVREVISTIMGSGLKTPLALHFHDTRGAGLANVLSALDAGARIFDASLGGIGGCPNSPGATGNIATEDLVFMLESMGLSTGIDIEQLVSLREDMASMLDDVPFYGHILQSGLPTGFAPKQKAQH